MTNKAFSHLRLHVEDAPSLPPSLAAGELPQLDPLCKAFEQATGWQVRYERTPVDLGEVWSAPVDDGNGAPAGRLTMRRQPSAAGENSPDPAQPTEAISIDRARPLALAICSLLSELNRLRRGLWQREAELAAGVPIASRPDEDSHLAERLEGVLKAGVEALGCTAGGLYLLDENTSSLKLRASFGLPQERLLDPARPLRGAVADLEALVGHAVVLEDTSLLPHWRCPEDFPAAVCVPVSSPTMPLGTFWIYSDKLRDFTPEETNLAEIVAGRLAADLEREMLLAASSESKRRDHQLEVAGQWQHDRLPTVMPLLDDYEVAGWTSQAEGIGGDFHDWTVLPDGRLALTVGDAQGALLEAGLNAAALQAAVKSHASYRHTAADLLKRVSDTLWTGSAGDQFASLFYAQIEPETGLIEFAQAGKGAALALGADDDRRAILSTDAPPLGVDPDVRYQSGQRFLAPGDVLVVLSDGARSAVDEAGLRIGESAIASLVYKHQEESAQQLLTRIRRLLDRNPSGQPAQDLTVLVTKRRAH